MVIRICYFCPSRNSLRYIDVTSLKKQFSWYFHSQYSFIYSWRIWIPHVDNPHDNMSIKFHVIPDVNIYIYIYIYIYISAGVLDFDSLMISEHVMIFFLFVPPSLYWVRKLNWELAACQLERSRSYRPPWHHSQTASKGRCGLWAILLIGSYGLTSVWSIFWEICKYVNVNQKGLRLLRWLILVPHDDHHDIKIS